MLFFMVVYVIDKPPPEVFAGNTWDSSGVNPEGKAWGIYIWTVECITHKHRWGGWFDWFVPLLAYKLSSCLLPLPCERSTEQLLAVDLPYCWLYSSKQAVDRLTVFYSPAWNAQSSKFWQRISLPVLLALGSVGVWITSQVPLTSGQSQVINWIAHDWVRWVGYRRNQFHGT